MLAGVEIILRHSLNSTDAAILAALDPTLSGDSAFLVRSRGRLTRGWSVQHGPRAWRRSTLSGCRWQRVGAALADL